jgi:hypothetical protein
MIIAMLRSVRRPRHALLLGFVLSFATMSASQAAVEISAKPTQNMTCAAGVCTPTAKKAVLNISDLDGMLSSGGATIKSTAQNPDIEIGATLSWSNTSRLTLDSYHAIAFNKPVTVLAAGTLAITTNDGGTGGDYRFFGQGHVEFKVVKDGNLYINGVRFALFRNMDRLIRYTHRGEGGVALAGNINAAKQTYPSSPIPELNNGVIEGLGNTISNLTTSGGALVGQLRGVIRDLGLLSVNINVDAQSQYVGALVGSNDGLIEYSYATGQVSVGGRLSIAGGLVGGNVGTITGSHADVAVSASDEVSAIGGLVGVNEGICNPCSGITIQSYATGTVTGGDNIMVGGLAGENFGGAITNSYATGSAAGGSNAFVGGLIGGNIDNPEEQSHPVVTASYATGAVTGGSGTDIGGLIGEDAAPPAITAAYWDLDTSGISDPSRGAGNVANDPGITGLSDTQLKAQLPSGFDKNVWQQKANINSGYPYLFENVPPK